MAQKPKSFEIAKKKGELGEQIIQDYLENRGWIVYFPFTKDRPHYFDMLATKDKERVVAIDVKTKARFNNFPMQGINVKSYNEYLHFVKSTNVPFYLIFVDDKNGDVHAVDIATLHDGVVMGTVIAWNLSQMKYLFKIDSEKIAELSNYDQRSYEYNPLPDICNY